MAFTIRQLAACGATELCGFDCSNPKDDVLPSLRDAFFESGVLVVRNQRLTAAQFARFAGAIAPLERTATDHPAVTLEPAVQQGTQSPRAVFTRWTRVADAAPRTQPMPVTEEHATDSMLYVHPDEPDVMILTNQHYPTLEAVGIVDDAHTWHSDGAHKPEPSLATVLYALRTPAQGGDTEFCSMAGLYDDLPESTKRRLEGRYAIHHWSKARNPRLASTLDDATRADYEHRAWHVPAARHPAVRTHPPTGRKSAFVSPRFTIALEGFEPAASETILGEVFSAMERPRHCYRHTWRDGDVVIWDNRCFNHRACGGYTALDVRTLLRVTLHGERPY